jgi:hypothetical protein
LYQALKSGKIVADDILSKQKKVLFEKLTYLIAEAPSGKQALQEEKFSLTILFPNEQKPLLLLMPLNYENQLLVKQWKLTVFSWTLNQFLAKQEATYSQALIA